MPQQPKYSGSGKKFLFKTSFSDVIAAGVDTNFDIKLQGAGQTVSQSAGNLNIASGTTVNAETILRSKDSFTGPITLRYLLTLSQRIANHNTFIELVDVVADSAAFNILSATSVAVTVDQATFDKIGSSKNIGQSMYISGLTGTGIPSQRGVIAAVAPNVTGTGQGGTITFTVAGYPGTGSGTVYLYGYNTYRILYDGTTATNVKFDTQRNGWNSTDSTLTCQTTASPGHSGILDILDGQATYLDELVATSTGPVISQRGRRAATVPDTNIPLFIQIRVLNGTVAPASTTTSTIGFVTLEDYNPQQVVIEGVRPMGASSPLPVAVSNNTSQTGGLFLAGTPRGSSNNGGNPLYIATGVSANPATVTTGRNVDLMATLIGALVNKPFSIPESDWSAVAAASGILNTTVATTLKTAAGAGIRNYITSIQIMSEALGAATELVIRDGAAGPVLWRTKIPASGLPTTNIDFPSPLKSTANTLLEVATLTASVTGAVYFNAQGYVAP